MTSASPTAALPKPVSSLPRGGLGDLLLGLRGPPQLAATSSWSSFFPECLGLVIALGPQSTGGLKQGLCLRTSLLDVTLETFLILKEMD